jgi:hypothetical protein
MPRIYVVRGSETGDINRYDVNQEKFSHKRSFFFFGKLILTKKNIFIHMENLKICIYETKNDENLGRRCSVMAIVRCTETF